MSVEKTERMNQLYDYYQGLLTDKQRQYLDLYYREDYSLGEIAENLGVSRQAVYDNIHRSEQTLTHYEALLQLVHSEELRQKAYQSLNDYVSRHYPTDRALQRLVEQLFLIDND
ncbi:MAG: putative DNA-binding protein [Aerococcus sp.]|nr:putative DNA-binding protein [Aerococcus sp.]